MIGRISERMLSICLSWLLTMVILLRIGSSAFAEEAPEIDVYETEMTFAVVREGKALCEPTCTEWISAFGKIEVDTDNKLKVVFEKLGNRKLPIIIESPGGDTRAALRIGRMIRKRGLDVAVGHTHYIGCRPSTNGCEPLYRRDEAYTGRVSAGGARCDSACTYVFMGGINRYVHPASPFGVHLGSGKYLSNDFASGLTPVETSDEESMEIATKAKPNVADYFKEMGIRPELIPTIFSSVKLIELSQERLEYYRIITGSGGPNKLIDAKLCKDKEPPQNCIMRP